MIFTHEDCKVYDGEELVCTLNASLLEKQHITQMGLVSLKAVHKERYRYIKKMAASSPDEREVLRWLNDKVRACDRTLQALWSFPVDDNYHRWWEVPHCTCGILDAKDSYGTPYRHINGLCPVHGE